MTDWDEAFKKPKTPIVEDKDEEPFTDKDFQNIVNTCIVVFVILGLVAVYVR